MDHRSVCGAGGRALDPRSLNRIRGRGVANVKYVGQRWNIGGIARD